jgi:primosomal protein N'
MPLNHKDDLELTLQQRALKPSARFSGDMGRMGRMVCVHCGIHSTPDTACRSCGGKLASMEHTAHRRPSARWLLPATRFTTLKW